MTRKAPAAGPSNNAASPEASDNGLQGLLEGFWVRFGRFGWDVLGVTLLGLALISLLGLLGWTKGTAINLWAAVLKKGVGWGWPILVGAVALLGLLSLRRHFSVFPRIRLGRVLALESAAFCVLALLSDFGAHNLERADAGLDGGVIGWGLFELLNQLIPMPWSTVLLMAFGLFFVGYGLGVFQWGVNALEKWLDEIGKATPARAPVKKAPIIEEQEVEEDLPIEEPKGRDPRLPPLTLLMDELPEAPDEKHIADTGALIEQTLAEFGLPARVIGYRIGPTITQYAVEPGYTEKPGPDGEMTQQKVRVAQISALQRDLALRLSAERLRIEAPVPGRSFVGIEVPNPRNTVVRLRQLMESEEYQKLKSPLAIVLGRDVSGHPVVADLGRMPHLLIAGTTGSGKSVLIAALVSCLAVNNTPEKLRMALLDPKMVELTRFNGLPHLFGQVETQQERMLGVLKWALAEMDHRYRLLEDARTRDVATYNRRMEKRGQPTLPRIVVLIDELADLMMSAPDQTEHSLVRLAQMARAVGIHLVVATQRPSTDVVTGLIKANFPARVAFTVASSIDSRVILDTNGAENLLGKGDMLFLNPEVGSPLRSQGVLVADPEVDRVIEFWAKTKQEQAQEAAPWEDMIERPGEEGGDALVQQAIDVVTQAQRASASMLQRRLRIGYPRAARLIDQLEEMGIVGPSMGSGKDREVLVGPEEDEEDAYEDGDEDGQDAA